MPRECDLGQIELTISSSRALEADDVELHLLMLLGGYYWHFGRFIVESHAPRRPLRVVSLRTSCCSTAGLVTITDSFQLAVPCRL